MTIVLRPAAPANEDILKRADLQETRESWYMGAGAPRWDRFRRGRTIAIAGPMVLALLTSTGACAADGVATVPTSAPSPPPFRCEAPATPRSRLIVWHPFVSRDVYRESFEATVDAFRARHPGVTVDLAAVDPGDMVGQLAEREGRDDLPDVLLLRETDVVRLADSGRTLPVEACLDDERPLLDALRPAIRRTWTTRGVLWAMPYATSTPVLWYNVPLLRAEGIAVPSTRAELDAALRTLHDRLGRPAMRYDLELAYTLAEQWSARRGRPLVTHDPDGRPHIHLDQPEVAADLAWLRDLHRAGLVEGSDATDGTTDVLGIADDARPMAFAIHTSASAGYARHMVETGAVAPDRGALAPLPGPGPDTPGALAGGLGLFLVRDAHTDPRSATAFITSLLSARSQAMLGARTGYVPARADATADPELAVSLARYPPLGVAAGIMDDPANRAEPVLLGTQNDLRQLIIRSYQRLLDGEDPGPVLHDAQAEADRQLLLYDTHR